MLVTFRDRVDAGGQLGRMLAPYAGRPDVMVLALPGPGVAVAREVARTLGAPLSMFVVRQLAAAGRHGAALGMLASGGVVVLDRAEIRRRGLSAEALRALVRRQGAELARREREHPGQTVAGRLCGRTVILVVEAADTGATLVSAVRALRALAPSWVVAAAPVLAGRAYPVIAAAADQVVCVAAPLDLGSVSDWYDDSRRMREAGEALVREVAAGARAREGAVR